MAMPQGNMVISDKMLQQQQFGSSNGEIQQQQRPWLLDDRDRFISWLRGEFAAANAIIDSLCQHLRCVGDPGDYDVAMACIQQRRCNWIPVLHMQQYFSVSEVQSALQQATWKKQQRHFDKTSLPDKDLKKSASRQWSRVDITRADKGLEKTENTDDICKLDGNNWALSVDKQAADGTANSYPDDGFKVSESLERPECDTSKSEAVKDEGTSDAKGPCNAYLKSGPAIIQKQDEKQNLASVPKTFGCIEIFDGKAVNVVEGLKLYEELCDSSEVSRLVQLAYELRSAGRRGQLQGQAFMISKRPMRGRGREIIQLGLAIADAPQEDDTMVGTADDRKMEPIPSLLQDVIERIVSMQVTTMKPDSCIIDFFNEGDHSQPHMSPPWFGRPVCILFLTECDMTFGRVIGIGHPGDYRGSLKLSLLPGSLLTMQGKSTDFAKHAISSIRKQRILVTFTKSQPKKAVPTDGHRFPSSAPPLPMAWGPLSSRAPSHVRHPCVSKQYGAVTTTGVLPVPSIHQQHLPPPSSIQPLFVTSPVAPAMPFPAPVSLSPVSSGWSVAPTPKHPPPRLPVPGTGVFLPPPGSSPSLSTPQDAFTPSATQASSPVENENKQERLNYNTNSSPKGKLDGNAQKKECNGTALSGKVAGQEEQQTDGLKKAGKANGKS